MSIPLLFSGEVCIELGLFPKFWENSPGKLSGLGLALLEAFNVEVAGGMAF